MKNILIIIAAIFAASIASAQTKSVLKNINGGTITESLTIGSGKTLTIASGATINATGATITGFTAAAAWGSITGTLSAQTDLQSALNAKQSTSAGLTRLLSLTTTNMNGGTFEMTAGSYLRLTNGVGGVEFTGGSGGSINMTGENALLDRNGGNAGIIQTSGSNEFNGGSLSLQSNGLNNAGSIDTTAGGSLTMGTASLNGGSVAGTILTTAGDGSSLTSLNASNLASGTVGTARLGTGTADSTTYLRGDGTWATVTGGVTSITGTANQITVTGTTTPTISLPATITGLTSVTSTTFVGALTGTASGNAVLGANTFTALQTVTQAVANAGVMASTGYSLTGSSAVNMIDLAGTWNTTGSPTALKINITKTAVGAAGKWLDIQEGSSSKFAIYADSNASIYCGNTLMFTPNFGGTGRMKMCGNNGFFFNPNVEFTLPSAAILGWTATSTGPGNNVQDTGLARISAGVVQVNSGILNTLRDLSLRNLKHSDYIEGTEMTAPAAPATNKGRIYFEDNGSNKTRLMVIFPSGAAQQIAIEP